MHVKDYSKMEKKEKKKYDQKKREQEKILDEMASGISGEKKSVDYQIIN